MTGGGHEHGGHSPEWHAWGRDQAIALLETPDRPQREDPHQLWDRVPLALGASVVEVGAGTGYYSIPAAERVGVGGQVHAVDLSADLVGLVRERALERGLPQLTAVQSTVSGIPLPDGIADVVLLANVLHDIPASTASEAVRLLKPRGRLVDIDWKKEDSPFGPPEEIRFSPEHAIEIFETLGLRAVEEWEFGPMHYGLVFRRASARAPADRPSKRRSAPPGRPGRRR